MTVETSPYQPLPVDMKAPDFELPDETGTVRKLSDYEGKNLIIVFYPKDQTPGCTRQLCALRDDEELFAGLNTQILASNPGSAQSHQNFIDAQEYTFPILVDAERTMARDYHALKDNGTSIERTVYIIDKEGSIRYAQQGLPSDETLAEAIRSFHAPIAPD